MAYKTKTGEVRRLVARREYKKALSIAKSFTIGISAEDRRNMVRGFECMTWLGFYSEVGFDEREVIEKAVETMNRLYGPRAQDDCQTISGLS